MRILVEERIESMRIWVEGEMEAHPDNARGSLGGDRGQSKHEGNEGAIPSNDYHDSGLDSNNNKMAQEPTTMKLIATQKRGVCTGAREGCEDDHCSQMAPDPINGLKGQYWGQHWQVQQHHWLLWVTVGRGDNEGWCKREQRFVNDHPTMTVNLAIH